jgi:phosphoribosylformylglycinamidine synthase II
MIYIEKGKKLDRVDPRSKGLLEDIEILEITGVEDVYINEIFWIEGAISLDSTNELINKVLIDPVLEEYTVNEPLKRDGTSIIITYKAGVFDAEAETFKEVAESLGYSIQKAKTGKRYIFKGGIKRNELSLIRDRILMNDLIQMEVVKMDFQEPASYKFKKNIIPIRFVGDEELLRISKEGLLALNLEEMKVIKDYFIKEGREPTDLELETIAQTWSEHCCHKTFKSPIKVVGEDSYDKKTLFDYIKDATKEIDAKNVLLSFTDNAGAIEFDREYAVTYKVETHNHPSALEPYGGAGTGIGGVIRDTMGCGLGAKPFASTDIFCFGDLDTETKELPPGVLHPRRIVRGVVAGVRDYGNRIGIPTVGGAVYFDKEFNYNPLIYVGSIGIIKKKYLNKEVKDGDLIVAVGGKTGRDGIHGATFSSLSLDEESQEVSGGAVQIGNPIEEKKMLDVLITARDKGLYRAITDCGAGGFSSAVGEMGKKIGAIVELQKAPLKYEGLSSWEIWVSESQERMVLAVPPENLKELISIFEEENVEYTILGKFGGGRLVIKHYGEVVGDMEPGFLFNRVPLSKKIARVERASFSPVDFKEPEDYNKVLLELLGSDNIGSREWIVRQYDHEVQAGKVVGAFSGDKSPSDGVVIRPLLNSKKVVVLGFGLKPEYGKKCAYRMAASSIDESLRNLIASGGDISNAALLDNFCFGDVRDEDILGDLVQATKACYDYATCFKTPFISGKDSLNNYFIDKDKKGKRERLSVPPTLLISSISVIENYKYAITSNFKGKGNLIYLLGETKNELGGSEFGKLFNIGGEVPSVNGELALSIFNKLSEGIKEGLFLSIHDISSGGLGVALSEMTFTNGIGCAINLSRVDSDLREDIILFSESNSRFVIEVAEKNKKRIEELFKGAPYYLLGKTGGNHMVVSNKNGKIINQPVDKLFKVWDKAVEW